MNQPLRQSQLGLKESKRPEGNDNAGFKGSKSNPPSPYKKSDWQGTTKGETKHTYKRG